jgi:hypothetical protein
MSTIQKTIVKSSKGKGKSNVVDRGDTPFGFLIVDASEPGEPMVYLVDGSRAPAHMIRHIRRTKQRRFRNIYEDNAETMDGLVNADADNADERADEVWAWIATCTKPENEFIPGDEPVLITHAIQIASA